MFFFKDTVFIKTSLDHLKSGGVLPIADLKQLLERTHSMLRNCIENSEEYNLGLAVICHVANIRPNDSLIKQLLYDCIVQSRVFLYKDMILTRDDKFSISICSSMFDTFAQEAYTLGESETVLTKDQNKLFRTFQKRKRIVVSAPTSFGKSKIVQEIIIHNEYKNILIVLPTIALLNETFVKFKNNPSISNRYNLYNSLGKKDTSYATEGNIFILTPEKTDLLLDKGTGLKFDFFTMDEIYKIQDGDDRSKVFTNCLYRLSKISGIDFYLIGPYFNGFSKKFLEKTNAEFIPFRSEIVQKNDMDVSKIQAGEKYTINGQTIKKHKSINNNLRDIFKAVEGQSLVYRGTQKRSAETVAKELTKHHKREVESELIDYIKDNIAADWSLATCLQKGIAFHHGALPKYIQTEIIEAFNNHELDAIVCTSTIVEGVNTTAKNVIIYDQFKGDSELTGFDVKNIKGRAGRFLVHFVGNIYSLVPLVEEENKGDILFSFYDKQDLDAEDTVQVDEADLDGANLAKRKSIEEQLRGYNIPIELIKSNKYIPIHKQISLINKLRADMFLLEEIHFTSNIPLKTQLDAILFLCHEYLFNDADFNNRNYTIGQLGRFVKHYVYNKPSIKELIAMHDGKETDTKVRNAFHLVSHFFEFAIPKYITAFENIFNFVYAERHVGSRGVNLTYLVTILEFGHSSDFEIAMKEAGVPNEIIKKVGINFKDCNSLEQIRIKHKLNSNLTNNLSEFERKLFNRYI